MKNNMENTSPLKARQSSRGGKSAGRATSTSSRRGGFGKSTGGRGKGGRNVGGYNVNTSFTTGSGWQKPPSGGIVGGEKKTAPEPNKPYTIDDKGKVVMTPAGDNTTNITNEGDKNITQIANSEGGKKWVPGTEDVYGTKKGKLPRYRAAWDANKDNINTMYKDFDAYETDMLGIKKGDKRDKEREEERKKAEETEERYLKEKGKPGYFENVPAGDINQSASIGKFTLKGNPMYRNFGIGGKPKK